MNGELRVDGVESAEWSGKGTAEWGGVLFEEWRLQCAESVECGVCSVENGVWRLEWGEWRAERKASGAVESK